MFKLVKGQVKSLEIPRPRAGQDVTGVGKIFVEFTNTDGSNKGTDINFFFVSIKLMSKPTIIGPLRLSIQDFAILITLERRIVNSEL